MFPRSALLMAGFLAGAAVTVVVPWSEREDLRQAEIAVRRAFQEARARAVESGRPVLVSLPGDIPLPGGVAFGSAPRWVRFSPLGSMEVDPESQERRPHDFGCPCDWKWGCDPNLGEIGIWNAQGWALFLFLDRPRGGVGEAWYVREGPSPAEDWVSRVEEVRDRMCGFR